MLSVYDMNFVVHKNDYLLINVVPFKVVYLQPYTESLVITLLFESFHEVHCMKLCMYIPQFCSNHGDTTKSASSLMPFSDFGKRTGHILNLACRKLEYE